MRARGAANEPWVCQINLALNCIGDEQSLQGVQLEEFHFIFVIDRSDEMIQIQV